MERLALFMRRSLDKEPMVVLGGALGAVGVGFALAGPPIRRALGYETFQWYGVDEEEVAVKKTEKFVYEKVKAGDRPLFKQ